MKYRKIIERAIIGLIAIILIVTGWMWGDLRKRGQTVQSPALDFALIDDRLQVFEQGGDVPIQEINVDPSALTDQNRAYFLQTPDINFDGYADLLMIFSQGAQNIYYDGWTWDNSARQFIYSPEIRHLPSPSFDESAKQIHTYLHGSATDNSQATYEYRGGLLTEIARIDQEYDEENDLFVITYYELNDKGSMVQTRQESLTLEELEARYDAA